MFPMTVPETDEVRSAEAGRPVVRRAEPEQEPILAGTAQLITRRSKAQIELERWMETVDDLLAQVQEASLN